MDDLIRFRVATEDRVKLEARAKAAGKPLSAWARDTLLAVCDGDMVEVSGRAEGVVVKGVDLGGPRKKIQPLRVDPEKIAAFQRKAGMDIFDAKKRRK